MQFKAPNRVKPHDGKVSASAPTLLEVAPDHFEVVTEDLVLCARLEGSLAVCLYDAVEEYGALLHLRFIARGAEASDLTDRTLATDLLLLDRCVEQFRASLDRGTDLQGRIAANIDDSDAARSSAEGVLALVGEYLKDSGVTVVSREVESSGARNLRFRPSFGQLRLEAAPPPR